MVWGVWVCFGVLGFYVLLCGRYGTLLHWVSYMDLGLILFDFVGYLWWLCLLVLGFVVGFGFATEWFGLRLFCLDELLGLGV